MPEHDIADGQPTAAELRALGEIVDRVVAAREAIARAQAAEAAALAEAGRLALAQSARISSPLSRDREMPLRSVAAEIASATRQSDRTVQHHIDDAMTLTSDYPATFATWMQGRISRGHISAVLDAGGPLVGTGARGLLDAAVVAHAEKESPARLRAVARAIAEDLQERTIAERHRDARDQRAVRVLPLEDGMAELIAILPAVLAHGIHDRLTQQAKAIRDAARAHPAHDETASTDGGGADGGRGAGGGAASVGSQDERATDQRTADRRTMDQLRADILTDMLLTATPGADPTSADDAPGVLGAIRATVQIAVPVLSLAGTGTAPATIDGRQPIDPDTARRLAGDSPGWDRVMTHPVTGAVLAVDRYRPNEDLRRLLRARDQHCRFPGCRMPAHRCDLDHTHDAARGGRTCACNLANLCKRHHTLKHATPWTVEQLAGGVLRWTSPTGRVYTDVPFSVVAFTPDIPPPPW